MQTRKHPKVIADAVLKGADPGRLVALLDGAAEREARAREAHESWTPPEISNRWTRRPEPPREERASRRSLGHRDFARLLKRLSPSQRALAASKHADEKPGGDPWQYRYNTVESLAEDYECSRRLILMGKKLRASKSTPLLYAVATGSISLGDALQHTDRTSAELRPAIRLVKERKARSLRQALT